MRAGIAAVCDAVDRVAGLAGIDAVIGKLKSDALIRTHMKDVAITFCGIFTGTTAAHLAIRICIIAAIGAFYRRSNVAVACRQYAIATSRRA